MSWVKKGLIIKPGKFNWMVSHAQNPFQEYLGDDIFRIHFSGRNRDNMAHGGYADININNPGEILSMPDRPSIGLGELGCFDDCGVMPSCVVSYNDKKYMYYTGWSQHRITPFTFFIGLAISEDQGKTYQRYSKAPVLGRNYHDPYLTCSPFVIREKGIWKMWYVSGTGWGGYFNYRNVKKLKHFYHIRYAESTDGINWNCDGTVCIDYRDNEYAIARPIVVMEDDIYKMWYCYRGGELTYRAGYAESQDGKWWTRKDLEVGIDVSETGWDSEMICYPCYFSHKGKKYLLYNGNNYGENGCGYAVYEG